MGEKNFWGLSVLSLARAIGNIPLGMAHPLQDTAVQNSPAGGMQGPAPIMGNYVRSLNNHTNRPRNAHRQPDAPVRSEHRAIQNQEKISVLQENILHELEGLRDSLDELNEKNQQKAVNLLTSTQMKEMQQRIDANQQFPSENQNTQEIDKVQTSIQKKYTGILNDYIEYTTIVFDQNFRTKEKSIDTIISKTLIDMNTAKKLLTDVTAEIKNTPDNNKKNALRPHENSLKIHLQNLSKTYDQLGQDKQKMDRAKEIRASIPKNIDSAKKLDTHANNLWNERQKETHG